ncbi:hypothetical protein KC349_g8264 [Hortaea werneckii]|nr:hypothetical protein KC349_g8264 [Hortaea werneckii]
MRFQLETLIKSKDEAVRRYEELVKSLNQSRLDDDSTNAFRPDSGSQSLNAGLNLMALTSNHAPPAQSNTNVKSTAPETDTGDKNCENLDLTKGLTEALADCHKAASGLSECLHIVHIQWRAMQKYDGDDIWKNYRLTDNAMRALEVVQAKSLKANLSRSHAQSQAQQQHAQGQVKPIELRKEKQEVSTEPQETETSDAIEGSSDTMDPPMINIDYASPTRAPADPTIPTEVLEECSTPRVQKSLRINRGLSGWQAWMVSSPLKDKTVPTSRNEESCDRVHTDERPFTCTVCGKAFARKVDRMRHETLHSGEKKFVCKSNLESGAIWGCGRSFARADALYRHFSSDAGQVCIKPLREEERANRRHSVEKEDASTHSNPHTGGFRIETGFFGIEEASCRTDHELPAVLLQQYPDLAHVVDRSDVSDSLSLSKDGARNDNSDIENDTDEGRSGKLFQEERDFLQSEKQCQPRKRKRESHPGDAREQRAAKKPAKKRARDLAAKAAAEGLSGDAKESDTNRDPKRPLAEKEVRLLIGAYECDHGEPSTASHRKTDGNVSVSTADVPSANDGVTPGSSCNSQQEGPHVPPLTLPRDMARRRPALRMQVPGSHLPMREDVDLKITHGSFEDPEDFEKRVDADTEDPVDALLREWTTIQVC